MQIIYKPKKKVFLMISNQIKKVFFSDYLNIIFRILKIYYYKNINKYYEKYKFNNQKLI